MKQLSALNKSRIGVLAPSLENAKADHLAARNMSSILPTVFGYFAMLLA
jgi:hypothetical protein